MKKRYRKPFRYKKKKSVLRSRIFWLALLGVIFSGAILYFLFFSAFFEIKDISISGNEQIAAQDVEQTIRNETSARFGNNLLLFSPSKTKNILLAAFPKISELSLKRVFPSALKMEIKERKPVAVFCKNENCFLIDRDGVVFELVANVTSTLPEVIDERDESSVTLAQTVMDKEDLLSITSKIFPEMKDNMAVSVKEFILYPEDKLAVKTAEGWEVYFNFGNEIPWQLTKLKAVLDEKIPQNKRKDLEYIDVQFGNFAPYKYK